MGKSRLIAELAELAHGRAATMVIGECLPLGDGEVPYAPIVGVLRSLVRDGALTLTGPDPPAQDELVRLLPERSAATVPPSAMVPERPGSSGRLFERLLAVFAGLAREAPIVLAIEDVHWSDPSTRDFLTFLARGIRRERLTLILTYRNDEIHRRHPARRFLHELERSGQATRLELRGFGRRELGEQVTAILDEEPPPELLDNLLDRAEGNPFFTEELLATVHEPGAPLPESLRDTMLYRVEGSSPQVRDVLRVAAVTGREVDHALLRDVSGIDSDDLLDAVREAVRTHLLVENPRTGAYAFRHALLREAVYHDLLAEERRTLHLELARTLSQGIDTAGDRGGSAELAHHWYSARQWPEALAAAIDAGIEAEDVHAPSEALLQFERALELWDQVDPAATRLSRIEVMQRASEVALLSGVAERAIDLARGTLDRLRPGDRVAIALAHERLGRYLWVAGRGEEALPEYRLAVELMPTSVSRERALVLAAEAQALMLSSLTDLSERRCEQALEIATGIGADEIRAHVLNTVCSNLANRGEFERAVASSRQALEVARRLGLVEEVGRAHVNGSSALDQGGMVRESIALARQGLETARALGADRRYGDFLRAEIARRLILGRSRAVVHRAARVRRRRSQLRARLPRAGRAARRTRPTRRGPRRGQPGRAAHPQRTRFPVVGSGRGSASDRRALGRRSGGRAADGR